MFLWRYCIITIAGVKVHLTHLSFGIVLMKSYIDYEYRVRDWHQSTWYMEISINIFSYVAADVYDVLFCGYTEYLPNTSLF